MATNQQFKATNERNDTQAMAYQISVCSQWANKLFSTMKWSVVYVSSQNYRIT